MLGSTVRDGVQIKSNQSSAVHVVPDKMQLDVKYEMIS